MFAVKKAAESILQRGPASKTLLSSRTVEMSLRALTDRWTTSELQLQLAAAPCDGQPKHSITLRWIPAHRGHPGNEQADRLVQQAAARPAPAVHDQPSLPWLQVRADARSCMVALWSDRWIARPDCRQTKLWLPEVDRSRSFEYLRLNRTPVQCDGSDHHWP